jgi:hypothetical protein
MAAMRRIGLGKSNSTGPPRAARSTRIPVHSRPHADLSQNAGKRSVGAVGRDGVPATLVVRPWTYIALHCRWQLGVVRAAHDQAWSILNRSEDAYSRHIRDVFGGRVV